MHESIKKLKASYRSRDGGLSSDFFEPCLKYCKEYHRAAGYFSSSVLRSWSTSLLNIVSNKISIKLLISPELSSKDAKLFYDTASVEQKRTILSEGADKIIEDVMQFIQNPNDSELRIQILAWLISSNQLEIRFALPKHIEDAGIFHEKSGIFYFEKGEVVAFEGSANETVSGHSRNYEKVQVFRSWVESEKERIQGTQEDFEFYWDGHDASLEVISLSEKSLYLIKEKAPKEKPKGKNNNSTQSEMVKWRHQTEAKNIFLNKKHGILEMATGTGKTRTSFIILDELFDKGLVNGAIICTSGNDLLDQWYETTLKSDVRSKNKLSVFRNYESHHDGQAFAQNPIGSIAIVSRDSLHTVLRFIDESEASKLIIIHDEIHGLGVPGAIANLTGTHKHFGYTLGLSATPEREYDQVGTQFIKDEVGPVIFNFELKDAIERGILVEFDYVALGYELSDDDKKRLSTVYKIKGARAKEGNPMSKEELWTKIAAVYKTAEFKPLIFADYLKEHSHVLKNSIIFVDTREYGEKILPIISEYTHLYRTYYSEHDSSNLVEFAKGNIDCLITCHKVSQGIDIQHLENVILFSSARARLETIQRIGRCLRINPSNPNKKALVVDFVRENQSEGDTINADMERSAWLEELSNLKRQEQ